MIVQDSTYVGGRERYHVRFVIVCPNLLRTRQRRFEQAFITYARRAAVEREKTIMNRERVALVYPNRLFHLESACSVLR